jgi:hypothetical protein
MEIRSGSKRGTRSSPRSWGSMASACAGFYATDAYDGWVIWGKIWRLHKVALRIPKCVAMLGERPAFGALDGSRARSCRLHGRALGPLRKETPANRTPKRIRRIHLRRQTHFAQAISALSAETYRGVGGQQLEHFCTTQEPAGSSLAGGRTLHATARSILAARSLTD